MKTAIKSVNSFVPQRMIVPTINKALSFLDGIQYSIVGNINKPIVGDIDLAIDLFSIVNKIKFNPFENDFWKELEVWLSKNSPYEFSINKGFKQFHLLVPLMESEEKISWAIDKDGSLAKPLTMGQIQLDLFIGNANWMKDFLSGEPKESPYKALYRNSLIAAHLRSLFSWEDDKIKSYFMIDYREGLKHRIENKETKSKSDSIVLVDANQMAKQYYNVSSWKEINSFEKVLNQLKKNNWHEKRELITKLFENDIKGRNKSSIIPKELYE